MVYLPSTRHLLRAKDLVDARYREPLDVPTLARVAHLSPAHFSREFRRVFGETPHQYLLTRRLERAAAMLRSTDHSVADICFDVIESHPTWLAGPELSHIPPDIDKWFAPNVVIRVVRFVQRNVLCLRNPIGRKQGPKLRYRRSR